MVGLPSLLWCRRTCFLGNGLCELERDVAEASHHALVHDRVIAVVELKAESVDDVGFLDLAHAVPEELRLGEVLRELGGVETLLPGDYLFRVVEVAALFCGGGRSRTCGSASSLSCLSYGVAHRAVTVEIHYWDIRAG